MKLLFVILLLFLVCMITQCLLGVGDNLISALSSNLKNLWDISPLELSLIYSFPYAVGLVACLLTGFLIPRISIRYIMMLSALLLFIGLMGMFGSLQIGWETAQIGAFTAARVAFQCGFFPMCICIDYIMSMCYKHYNDKQKQEEGEVEGVPWWQRLYRSFSLSFGMIGAMQTYSDYGGKMVADLLLPLLSLDSLKTAMSSMIGVAVLLILCIVAVNYFTEIFHVQTKGVHRGTGSPADAEHQEIDWAEYFRQHDVGFSKSIGLLTLLNFIWIGSWNAFLMTMPQIWEALFGLTTFEAPVHVGYGILASCVLGGLFSILPPSKNTLRAFAVFFVALALPTFAGMFLPDAFPYPLLLSMMVCCMGALMNIVIMMFIPFLFRNLDFAMAFVWLEFSRTMGSITLPIAYGFILTVDHGPSLCIIFFGTLVAFGFVLYMILMRMAISNVQLAAKAASQNVTLPLDALVEAYDSATDWSGLELASTPRFDHV